MQTNLWSIDDETFCADMHLLCYLSWYINYLDQLNHRCNIENSPYLKCHSWRRPGNGIIMITISAGLRRFIHKRNQSLHVHCNIVLYFFKLLKISIQLLKVDWLAFYKTWCSNCVMQVGLPKQNNYIGLACVGVWLKWLLFQLQQSNSHRNWNTIEFEVGVNIHEG